MVESWFLKQPDLWGSWVYFKRSKKVFQTYKKKTNPKTPKTKIQRERLSQPRRNLELKYWGLLDSQVQLCDYNTFFPSISHATGRKEEETVGTFVKLDTRGIQRLYFQLLIRKTSQLIFFSMHIEFMLLRKQRQIMWHKAQTQEIENNSKVYI